MHYPPSPTNIPLPLSSPVPDPNLAPASTSPPHTHKHNHAFPSFPPCAPTTDPYALVSACIAVQALRFCRLLKLVRAARLVNRLNKLKQQARPKRAAPSRPARYLLWFLCVCACHLHLCTPLFVSVGLCYCNYAGSLTIKGMQSGRMKASLCLYARCMRA